MFLDKTESLNEKKRFSVQKRIKVVTSLFILAFFLPILTYLLFVFGVFKGKPAFNSDIQEPVAMVVTSYGVGTAFLISPTLMLTARHVVEGLNVGDEVDLYFEQSKSKLQTKGKIIFIASTPYNIIDNEVPLEYFLTDVAVIEVAEILDIEPLFLGESELVSPLDEVILIGYPNGDYSISMGHINSEKYQGHNLFKLDATTNPGNSGGPLILKEDNSVIGILVGGSGPFMQGENIAIKIDDVKKILNQAGISY